MVDVLASSLTRSKLDEIDLLPTKFNAICFLNFLFTDCEDNQTVKRKYLSYKGHDTQGNFYEQRAHQLFYPKVNYS